VNLTELLNAQEWITSVVQTVGPLSVLIVCCILFAETGLLFGFFLPGDSILFPMGLMMATGILDFPLWLACLLFTASGWLGDQTGYWIGRKAGPAIFKRPDSRFFNHRNVERTQKFFERYGPKAIIFAHFVPVMRTFVPVAAGVGKMPYPRYLKFNFIGVTCWATGVTLVGAGLGQIPFVRENAAVVTISFLIITTIPIITELIKARRERGN
jgi:membrane-associated protein